MVQNIERERSRVNLASRQNMDRAISKREGNSRNLRIENTECIARRSREQRRGRIGRV